MMPAVLVPVLGVSLLLYTPEVGPRQEYDLRLAAADARSRGQYRQCAELHRQAMEADPARARWNAYDQACCLALLEDQPAALDSLRRALDLGFALATHLASDDDLTSLRSHAQWPEILARARTNEAAYRKTINQRLYRHYLEDQAARGSGADRRRQSYAARLAADDRRRELVTQILARGGAKASDDHYHAAMILQHGREPEQLRRAHQLAVRAVELDPTNDRARWLAAAARDRELVTLKRPQLYGTQYRIHRDRRLELHPVDPGTTDEDRRRWNVEPLAHTHLMIVRHNRRLRENQAATTTR